MTRQERPTQADFSHWTQLAVRWGDMDSLGHVNNAVFFSYDEQARLEFFNTVAAGDPRFWKDYGLILGRIACDFIQQVHFPATLSIGYRITQVGRSSMKGQGAMFLTDAGGETHLVALTESVIVWYDYLTQKSAPVPEAVRLKLGTLQVVAPVYT